MPGGPTPGERFGPYDVLAQLGAGGMGVVFRARDTRLGREVALKALPPESLKDTQRLQRFEAEARAASALNHPNVLAVYDVGTEAGVPFMVTELLLGETLRDRLRSGPLSARKVIELGVQVAQGLAAVHEKGIVHRDLKPENLFLTRDGHLKILDFGVARTLEGATPPTGTLPLTQDGAVMGTAGYMSPEQVRGRPADARSDLFALGAILLEALSGEMAFPGETPVERGYAILNHEPRPAQVAAPSTLLKLVHRCLEKDPAQRFQHARDVVFALEAAIDTASAPVVRAEPVQPARPNRTTRYATVGVMVAVATALWVSTRVKDPPAAPPAPVAPATLLPSPTSHRVSYRAGSIANARFRGDGRGIAYAGAFDQAPMRVFTGVLDGPQMNAASAPQTRLFDVSDKDDVMYGQMPEDEMRKGLVLSRGSLAGGAPRPLYDGVLWADFGPDEVMVLTRIVESKFVIECPPGNVIWRSSEQVMGARLSPDGKYVAFMHQPVPGDDRGTLEIIDRTGRPIARSESAWTLEGLAWHPSGKEVWFSAGYADVSRKVHALSLEGQQRQVYAAPGSLTLLDIDAKGRMLLTTGLTRSRMFGKVNGETRERSLSWLDGSMPLDLSDDGKVLLFLEGFGPASTEVQTWLRRYDKEDDSPMLLASGWGRALSPDKRWAIVSPTPPFNTLRLVPTGAGTPRDLAPGGFASINHVRFFPDGKRIVFSAVDADNHPHLYVQSALEVATEDDELMQPTRLNEAELALSTPPSPDGKWVVGYDWKQRRAYLVSLTDEEAAPKQLEALTPLDFPLQWTQDGKRLWVLHRTRGQSAVQLELKQYELATNKVSAVGIIAPPDPVGMEHIKQGVITPDGRSYVYTVNQELDELYVVENVR